MKYTQQLFTKIINETYVRRMPICLEQVFHVSAISTVRDTNMLVFSAVELKSLAVFCMHLQA